MWFGVRRPCITRFRLRSDLRWTGERWDCGTDFRGPDGHVDSVAAMEQRWFVHHNNDIAYHTHIQSILQYYYPYYSILYIYIYWPWTIFWGEFPEKSDRCFPKSRIKISDSKSSTAACEAWITPGAPRFGFWSSGPGSWSSFAFVWKLVNYPPEFDGLSSCSHIFIYFPYNNWHCSWPNLNH